MALEFKLGKATRDAYGEALVEVGQEHKNVVVLDSDLSKSTKSIEFAKKFPERFVNCGISEANMIGMAAGFVGSGMIPFASSFASFIMCKGFDQIRMSVANPHLNVKLVGSHSGISLGEDGASQQSIEDIGLACSLPQMTVLVPCDETSTKSLTHLMAKHEGPVYLRTGRPKAATIYKDGDTFEIGKAKLLRDGKDVTVIAIGLLVIEALIAADQLEAEGISVRVVDMFCVKPIDIDMIAKCAKETGAIITAEEHLIGAGLSGHVAQVVAQTTPVPMEYIGIDDTYAESGKPDELLDKYGLRAKNIVDAIHKVLKRK
ncbi:MAG: transketolase family protein [Candidatus Sericytochromatia bacterium]|nr:transketolase family protein [Candidatus Sericytochromatia bacterium]